MERAKAYLQADTFALKITLRRYIYTKRGIPRYTICIRADFFAKIFQFFSFHCSSYLPPWHNTLHSLTSWSRPSSSLSASSDATTLGTSFIVSLLPSRKFSINVAIYCRFIAFLYQNYVALIYIRAHQ